MKGARGLEVTADYADAIAAADDFAARLLRADQGLEAILEAVKRWPTTPILQLYAAAFWLYGQTDDALANAAAHLAACAALGMNARERALHRALSLWQANENLRALGAMEALTGEWPDDHIWGITPESVVEQLDAIALLWRIEMAGKSADGQLNARWVSIADHVAPRAAECFMPFMNAHYAYALARAGRADALAATLAVVRERSAARDEEATRVWAPVGRAVVEAAAAFGAGERARAAALLDPVMPQMTAIGGRDAQDDLFRQAYLRGLQAAGRHTDAMAYSASLIGAKKRTPLDHALAS